MSFLKKLFGGGAAKTEKPVAVIEHEGYTIHTTPIPEGGQFRVCALIRKEVDGEMKEHTFIRADICSSAQEASDIAIRKSQQIIKEQGMRIFS